MSFGREKRLLLGLAALLAPLPLPWNEIVGWVSLAIYEAAVIVFLVRAARPEGGWLPYWAMNLLAILYLPFIALDLSVFWRGQILQPLVHLVLFALAVKLYGLHRENDKWHAFLAIFFLFVTSMGTSVHPSVVVFFVAQLAVLLLVLARFSAGHLLERHGFAGAGTRVVPLRGFVLPATVLSLLVAMPIFAILPRFQNPYVVAPVGGGGGRQQSGGFRDRFELDSVGRARADRTVVLRMRYDGTPRPGHQPRFKAAVYERFEERSWIRARGGFERLRRGPGGVFELAEAREWGWMEIWLLAQNRPELVLPVEAVALDVAATQVAVGVTGVVSLPVVPPGTLNYRVGLGPGPLLPAAAAGQAGDLALELDPSGVTPRIAELARQVMGEGADAERAQRAERFLRDEFTYSLDAGPRELPDPLEDFLLRSRSGHCELFASSMVLMLRSQGIAARLVSGYLGADYNQLEGYYMVRNSNAHAWVEAYLPDGGWRLFDPTPADGRPQPSTSGLASLAGQAWDYLVFRWDRYVLSYGFYDQARAFWRLREVWLDLRGWLFGDDEAPRRARRERDAAPAPSVEPASAPAERRLPVWAPLLALLAAALAVWRWRRGEFTATAAYRRLRARLAGAGAPVGAATAPLELSRLVAERRPRAARPASQLVELYLRESFGGHSLEPGELERARALLRETLRELRRRRAEPDEGGRAEAA